MRGGILITMREPKERCDSMDGATDDRRSVFLFFPTTTRSRLREGFFGSYPAEV